jgi:hypothetical protein
MFPTFNSTLSTYAYKSTEKVGAKVMRITLIIIGLAVLIDSAMLYGIVAVPKHEQ